MSRGRDIWGTQGHIQIRGKDRGSRKSKVNKLGKLSPTQRRCPKAVLLLVP